MGPRIDSHEEGYEIPESYLGFGFRFYVFRLSWRKLLVSTQYIYPWHAGHGVSEACISGLC